MNSAKTTICRPQTTRMIVSLVTYVIFIMALVIVLAVFNIQLYPLILSVGVISAVVVLGSQLLISNLLGGTVVYVEKPFLKGDLIKVGDNMGVVQGVSIRATTLKGLNGLNITIPNSTFLTTPITNYTRTKHYLIKVPFTMPRDDQPLRPRRCRPGACLVRAGPGAGPRRAALQNGHQQGRYPVRAAFLGDGPAAIRRRPLPGHRYHRAVLSGEGTEDTGSTVGCNA